MAITSTDLLLVQRGSQPHKAEAQALATFVKGEVDANDIGIASTSQLGVIRVGNNLTIDPGSGVLDVVIPAGLEYQGIWTSATTVPSGAVNGNFWVWDGGDGVTLSNVSWGNANGVTVDNGDRIFYDGSTFDVVPGGGGGIEAITGAAPIQVDNSNPDHPEVSILPASDTAAGSLSAADKAKLDTISAGAEANVAQNLGYTASASNGVVTIDQSGTNATIPVVSASIAGLMSPTDKSTLDGLVASPGGVLSVVAGVGIDVDNSNSGAPVVSVEFGATTGSPATVMPYDISLLSDL